AERHAGLGAGIGRFRRCARRIAIDGETGAHAFALRIVDARQGFIEALAGRVSRHGLSLRRCPAAIVQRERGDTSALFAAASARKNACKSVQNLSPLLSTAHGPTTSRLFPHEDGVSFWAGHPPSACRTWMAAMAERTWDVDAAQAVFVVQVFLSWLSVNWFPALGRSPRRVCLRELETGRRRSARYGFGPPPLRTIRPYRANISACANISSPAHGAPA